MNEYKGNLKAYKIPVLEKGKWLFAVKHLPTNLSANMNITFELEEKLEFEITFRLGQLCGFIIGKNSHLELDKKDLSEFQFTIKKLGSV